MLKPSKIWETRKSRKTPQNLMIHQIFDLEKKFFALLTQQIMKIAPGTSLRDFWFATSAEKEDFFCMYLEELMSWNNL